MADQVTRSMTCPTCGKTARAVLVVQLAAADGDQRITVEQFSCPEHDFATEADVLQALGYA